MPLLVLVALQHLNSVDRNEELDDDDLKELLSSYLITEMLEGDEDKERHVILKNNIHKRYPFWDITILFLQDTIGSEIFQRKPSMNPFIEHLYSFEDAVRMAER